MRVGVEVGGTFTDLIASDGVNVRVAKAPSVPGNPEEGVFAALRAADIPLAAVTDLVHGSTVATNAVLERKGGRVAFITTAGFTDLLLIQRQDRPRIYQLVYEKPEAICGRADTLGIEERMLATGEIATPLDAAAAETRIVDFLLRSPYDAVAICLLNAYANPTHEVQIADIVRRIFPQLPVTCSHEVSREFREYERASTTVLSAYVQPVIDRYLSRLQRTLADDGFKGRFSVMQSNGGRLPASAMRRNAITALFSGPAAGVAGAVRQIALSGRRNLITFDMGGTSADVCLISNGAPAIAPQTMIDGLPVRTPVIDIATVGSGGGSIVWRDAGGMLRVGPHSAGADPGPASYGRGGRLPTITDAHVIRGTLPADSLLGGHMALDADAARAAFAELAAAFGMTPEEIADSAVRIADANIVRAIQLISTEQGLDPRDYALAPFGGAGPLHAARIAEELGLTTIVTPCNAGVLSAFGLLAADFKQFEALTRKVSVDDLAPQRVRQSFADMEKRLAGRFHDFGVGGALRFSHVLQMRFVGQAFELDVSFSSDEIATLTRAGLEAAFKQAHHKAYFHAGGDHAGKRIEIVGFHLGATADASGAIDLPRAPATEAGPPQTRSIYENRARRDCLMLTRAHLENDAAFWGPALLRDDTSTLYIPPDWSVRADAAGNLILERQDA